LQNGLFGRLLFVQTDETTDVLQTFRKPKSAKKRTAEETRLEVREGRENAQQQRSTY